MQTVYVRWHQFEFRDTKEQDLEERAKLVGIYSNEQQAKLAIERVKGQAGFRDYPEGFVIDSYTLNTDNWADGFITWREAAGDGAAHDLCS